MYNMMCSFQNIILYSMICVLLRTKKISYCACFNSIDFEASQCCLDNKIRYNCKVNYVLVFPPLIALSSICNFLPAIIQVV